jgi:glycosyltransferase involved in cell wall biosynthesis
MTVSEAVTYQPSLPATENRSGAVELTIVMPCLNESETLETCLVKAQRFLKEHQVNGEIVVGDNGSTDGSQEIARRNGARVVNVPIRGYGAALYHAILAAEGKYIVMGDSDDSYDFTALAPFVERLRAGDDLVMGNRFRGGIRNGAMPWKNRYIGNPILSAIGRLFFRCPAKDFHCGLRGFSKDAFDRLDLRTTGMEFASEMVIKATLMKMRISEVPTTLDPDGRSRPPHLRPWRDGWRHLRFMLLYSPLWLFFIPGLTLMVIGVIIGSLLLLGPLRLGHIALNVHTLLYAAAAIEVGFQAVAFAAFSNVYAIQEGLRPPDERLKRLFNIFRLEVGALIGAGLLLLGLLGSAFAVWRWHMHAFGALDPDVELRLVIPSILSLTLGCEVILASFFLSVLGLKVRKLSRGETP